MPAGRPDKIDETYVAKAQEYIDGAWKTDGSVIPTVEGMAIYLNVSRRTIYEAEELSHTLEQVQRLQAGLVLNKGLTGEFNANIGRLILSAKHGYREQSEQTVTQTNMNLDSGDVEASVVDDFVAKFKSSST
jgi:hypothetical protein